MSAEYASAESLPAPFNAAVAALDDLVSKVARRFRRAPSLTRRSVGAGLSAARVLCAALVLQAAVCFTAPMPMGAVSRRGMTMSLGRRQPSAPSGWHSAASWRCARRSRWYCSLRLWPSSRVRQMPPSQGQISSSSRTISSSELYAIQRLRKAAGGGGASDMEKIADAMGHSFACMESKLCRKPVVGAVYGYD